MQEPIALPPPGLRSGIKAVLRVRIMMAELDDEQALIATSLLALSDGAQVSISAWVAGQLFDCSPAEWDACVAAMAAAGLVDVEPESAQRVTLRWRA